MEKIDFSDRNTYLGASEVGAALNMSKYMTQHQLWLEKTLRAPRTPHKHIFDRGHHMENVMCDILQGRYEITVDNREVEYSTKEREWLRSHIDGMISPDSAHIGMGIEIIQDGPGIVEFKAPGSRAVREYEKFGIPGYYLMQMHMNMYNAGCKWGIFIVMDYDNWDIIPIYMTYDPELLAGCLPFLDKFWASVVQDIEPPEHEEPYRQMGPSGTKEGLIMEDSPLASDIMRADMELSAAKDAMEATKAEIRDAMTLHDSDVLQMRSGGHTVTARWKMSSPSFVVDGKALNLWTHQLVEALLNHEEKTAVGMAEVFNMELFMKQRAASRRFTYKIKED